LAKIEVTLIPESVEMKTIVAEPGDFPADPRNFIQVQIEVEKPIRKPMPLWRETHMDDLAIVKA
jgi:hypothetical protein